MLILRYNDASVAVSKAGKTSVHFVEKGTNVDASYYRETLQQRCLLPEIRQNSEVWRSFSYQQNAPPLCLIEYVKSTVEFLQRTVPNFIEPSVCPLPNSLDLNPVVG